MKTIRISLTCAALIVCASSSLAAGSEKLTQPDFTKGEAIPANAKHDWNLGPTGGRGWMFSDKLVTSDARQIAITAVDKGSPADGVLAVGDVLLGAGGKPFSFDPRTELGRAITAAETEAGGGKLALTRWRAGKSDEVVVKLPVLGSFSATAPFDCPKSKRILEQGIRALAARVAAPEYARKQNGITRSLNALALLASGDAAHLPLVKREAQWAADFTTSGYSSWYYGYVMMLVAEYITATGDQSLLPGLRRLALETARGQSAVGSWGHKFAMPDGRLSGYGMMNAPGLPLTIGLVMARDAGVKDPDLAKAIELSAQLMRFYIGKSAVPYGDHPAWTQTVPQLRATLQHPDLWLRVKAADALAAIGKPALAALPDLLDRIARTPGKGDPRAIKQRYLCSAVFDKMLINAKTLEGVNRDQLRTAIARGLQNQDGHARSKVSRIYERLTFDEIKPLLPAIREAIVKPAPSGEMFADGVRLVGLKLLAAHHVEEGITACADYIRTQNPWASQERIKEIPLLLLQYGAHAQTVIPQLLEAAEYFEQREPDFPKKLSLQKAAAVREAIAKIEAVTERPQ